jgi:hypothetical protein
MLCVDFVKQKTATDSTIGLADQLNHAKDNHPAWLRFAVAKCQDL